MSQDLPPPDPSQRIEDRPAQQPSPPPLAGQADGPQPPLGVPGQQVGPQAPLGVPGQQVGPQAPLAIAPDQVPGMSGRHEPVAPGNVPWSLGLGFGAVGIFLGVQFAVGLVGGIALAIAYSTSASAMDELPTAALLTVGGIGQAVALVVVVAVATRNGRTTVRDLIGRVRGLADVGVGIGLGLLALIGTSLLTYLGNALLAVDDAPEQSLVEVADEGTAITLLVVLLAVVLAPPLEELVFRGVLFPALRDRWGLVWGIIVSGLVFGLVHVEVLFAGIGGLVGVTALSCLGMFLAWTRQRWGGLAVPVAVHAAFNGITLSLVLATTGA